MRAVQVGLGVFVIYFSPCFSLSFLVNETTVFAMRDSSRKLKRARESFDKLETSD
jgi:hypothetical protein